MVLKLVSNRVYLFNLTDNFALVAHYGFLGYRDKYNGNSVSGLSLKGNELSFSLYYCF